MKLSLLGGPVRLRLSGVNKKQPETFFEWSVLIEVFSFWADAGRTPTSSMHPEQASRFTEAPLTDKWRRPRITSMIDQSGSEVWRVTKQTSSERKLGTVGLHHTSAAMARLLPRPLVPKIVRAVTQINAEIRTLLPSVFWVVKRTQPVYLCLYCSHYFSVSLFNHYNKNQWNNSTMN